MNHLSVALFVLLVLGHLAVTCVDHSSMISLFSILPAVVIVGHTFAYSFEFARNVIALYDQYETMNFYHPGSKLYDDRYSMALCQIAVEQLVRKLERLCYSDPRQSDQEPLSPIPTSTPSTSLPFWLPAFLPELTWKSIVSVISCWSIVVYFLSGVLRDMIAELIKSAFSSLAAVVLGPIVVYAVMTSTLAAFLGTWRGLNLGLLDFINCIVFILRISLPHAPFCLDLATLICAAYFGINLFIPVLRCFVAWMTGYWATALTWVFFSAVLTWAYPIRGRLYRCSKKTIASIRESAWAWDEMYDKDHDLPVEPVQKPERAVNRKSNILCGEPWPPAKEPVLSNGTGAVDHAPQNQVCTAWSEARSRRIARLWAEASTTEDTRRSAGGVSSGIPQASAPLEEPRLETRSGTEARRAALAAISTPANSAQRAVPSSTSTSPSTSHGSSPQLAPDLFTPDTSPEIGSLAAQHISLATPSRFSLRTRAKFSPLDAPKRIFEVRTTVGEDKAMALLYRSERKQRAKLRKERKVALGMAMEVDELTVGRNDSPKDVEMGVLESGPAVESRVGGIVESQAAPRAQPNLAPVLPPMAPSSSFLDPQTSLEPMNTLEAEATGEPTEPRETKGLPRRRHSLAARSFGTDAPLMTSEVALRSNVIPVGSTPWPSHSVSVAPENHVEISTATPAAPLAPAAPVAPVAASTAPPTPIALPIAPVDIPATTNPSQVPSIIETPTVQPAPMDNPATSSDSSPSSSSASRLDTLASIVAAAAPVVPTVPLTTSTATPDLTTAQSGRMVPVYTWLMDDGTKRVMKKGEMIPARAQYTLKSEKGSRLMSVGAKPLRV